MIQSPFLNAGLAWLQNLSRELLGRKSLSYGLSLAAAITLGFGLLIYLVDPNVHSLWDGTWYAWVTLTHVGYGDVVPTSFLGRVLASLLILFGIALLALFTATFSATLIGRDVSKVESEESLILKELQRLHERLDRLENRDGQ